MRAKKDIMATAALLHDVGKLMRRSGYEGSHNQNSSLFIKELFAGTSLFSDEEVEYIARLALHHHPQRSRDIFSDSRERDPNLHILMEADSDSAAERKEYKGEPEGSIERNPLTSILSAVNIAFFDDAALSDLLVYYPAECDKGYPMSDSSTEKTKTEAQKMYEGLKSEAAEILKRSQTKEDFINSLNFLLKKYMTYVTSSGKENIRDISLYHHSFTTAAFAVDRFIDYEADGNHCSYVLLLGKIFDEERYVFDNLNKNIEKPLKRVFTRINLLTIVNTLIPYQMVRELGVYTFNVVYSAGGSFALILPQALKDHAVQKAGEVKRIVAELFENKVFFEYALREISPRGPQGYEDFRTQFFDAARELHERKYRRNLADLTLNFDREYSVCQNCGINTAHGKYCRICRIEDRWINIDVKTLKIPYANADIRHIEDPALLFKDTKGPAIFFDYNYCWETGNTAAIVRQIGSYEITKRVGMCEECRYKENCDIKGTEGGTVSLNCLAGTSPNDALIATARIDLDDTEFLLYRVYPIEKFGERYPFSISRLSYLSEQIDLFFSSHVPKLVKARYGDKVMVLLGGGDEIILTGIWEDVLRAAVEIEKAFDNYITGGGGSRREVTLSLSVVFHRPHMPFSFVLDRLEQGSRLAKERGNSVAVNGQVMTWANLSSAIIHSDRIKDFVENEWISRKFLFDMLKLVLSSQKRWKGAIATAKRAALFNYIVTRNVISKEDLPHDAKEAVRQLFYDLMVGSDNLDMSRFIIELAIRKTKVREEE